MDQFDAFQYFLTNLFLHNLVLVVLAGGLGVVMGRLLFGSRKVERDQLREALKEHENRARAVERGRKELEERHAKLVERVEAGDTSFSPEQEEELAALRSEKEAMAERMRVMAAKLEEEGSQRKVLESEKEGLEAELAEALGADEVEGARAEVEKLLVSMQGLEQRVLEAEGRSRQEFEEELEGLRTENQRLAAELAAQGEAAGEDEGERERLAAENARLTEKKGSLEQELEVVRHEVAALEQEARSATKKARQPAGLPARRGTKADIESLEKRLADAIHEREQVDKASAVLRKEMRGLRNKVKDIEQQESREGELEQLLKDAEERLTRAQATVAKESRLRASLEKMVEDLEWKLADAGAERERLRDAVDAHDQDGEDGSSGASGAADALRGALGGAGAGEEAGARESVEGESAGGPDVPGDDAVEDAVAEDDLTRIKGVGAVLEKKLRAAGVTTFRQIADWSDEELAAFSRKLRLRNRAAQGDWRGQARAFCEGE